MTPKERILLVLLSAINFTHILDFMILMPLGNYLMPYFKISPQEFSILVSSYTISAAVSGFASAFFVDKFDRKQVLLVGYVGFLAGTLACGIAPTYGLLLIARLFAGLFGGLIGAQVISIISDIFTYERRGAAMGAVMSAFSLASTLGVPFALYLANLFSWHAPFLLVGGLGIVVVPLIIKYVPTMTGHIQVQDNSTDKWASMRSLLQHPKQMQAIFFSGLVMFGHFLIIPFINPFMEFNVGYSKSFTPLIYLVGGVCSFFAANILGKLSDKYGKLSIFNIAVIAALPLVLIVTNMPAISYFFALTVFGLWFSAATGRGVTAQAMVSNVVTPEHRGSFQSFNSSIQQLGSGIASLISGYMVIKEPSGKLLYYDWVGYLSIIVLLFCVYLANQIFGTEKTTPSVFKPKVNEKSAEVIEN